MNKTMSILLEPYFSDFVERQVRDGHYGSAGEVVQAGLLLLEERQAYIAAVREALIEGENSGPSEPFDFDEFLQEMRERHAGRGVSS